MMYRPSLARVRFVFVWLAVATLLGGTFACGGEAQATKASRAGTSTPAAPLGLDETAARFAADIGTMNTAGLVTAFTTHGLSAALSLPEQLQSLNGASDLRVAVAQKAAESATVCLSGSSGADHITIATFWKPERGVWKIDDIVADQSACAAVPVGRN